MIENCKIIFSGQGVAIGNEAMERCGQDINYHHRSIDGFIEGTEEGQFSIAHFRCVLDDGRLASHGNGRRGQLDGRGGKSVGGQMSATVSRNFSSLLNRLGHTGWGVLG